MKIHEYQAKTILRKNNVPVPESEVALSPAHVSNIVEKFGNNAVIKDQIHAGGRGKRVRVNLVKSIDQA